MTPQERIARLEALLERVLGRTLDPREPARVSTSPAVADPALVAESLDEPGWSIPPPRMDDPATNGAPDVLPVDLPSEPMLLSGDEATSLDDYEVAEVVELDGDGDDDAIRRSRAPSAAPPASSSEPPEENLLESRQRLVSALPTNLEDEEDESEPRSIPLVQRRPSQIPPDGAEPDSVSATRRSEDLDEEVKPAEELEELGELELIGDADEPPPSSRRPIALQLSQLDDFEEELAPATPPPESGRQQVAAQESVHLEENFSRVRDSARAEEFVGGAMPMLEAPPMDDLAIALNPVAAASAVEDDAMEMVLPRAQAPGEFVRSFEEERPAPPPARSLPQELAPETVNPDLVSTSRVAIHEGSAPSFKPATFGDLLDEALSL